MLSLRDYAEIEIASGAPDAVLVEATEVDDARHWIGVFESPTRGLLLCLSRRVDSKTGSAGSTDIGDVTAICPPRLCAAAGRMPTGAIDAQVTGTPEAKLTRVSPSTWVLALGRELPIDICVQPTDAEGRAPGTPRRLAMPAS